MYNQKGFSFVEGLIVVVILFVLGGMLFAATEPSTEAAEERDAVRRSEVVSVLNAVIAYKADAGALPAGLDTNAGSSQVIGSSATGCLASCGAVTVTDSCLDLRGSLVTQYLEEIPMDPKSGTVLNTDYYINVNPAGNVVVGACDPEISKAINVTR